MINLVVYDIIKGANRNTIIIFNISRYNRYNRSLARLRQSVYGIYGGQKWHITIISLKN